MIKKLIPVTSVIAALGCESKPPPAPPPPPKTEVKPPISRDKVREQASSVFGVLPAPDSLVPKEDAAWGAKVALGRTLYFDTRLSKNQDLSCNSCHDLAKYGVDAREANGARTPTSMGHKGQFGGRNSPTVYNAVFYSMQFWDGRAPNLTEQAKGPVLNPVEMAMPSEDQVVKVLKSIPDYGKLFTAAFPGDKNAISFQNMAVAIAAFETGLVTPAPFDEFIGGKLDALTETQVKGLDKFLSLGCAACHNGRALGGSSFQKMGLLKPYPTEDTGRFQVTKVETDKFMFRVPSLRNIAKTGPYLHDGSVADLGKSVEVMAEYQTAAGKLTPEDTKLIVDFLGSLTGALPAPELIVAPELPKSGPKTPKPDPS